MVSLSAQRSRLVRFLAVLAFGTLSLSACSSAASNTPEVTLKSDGILGKSWSFTDSDGDVHAMRFCKDDRSFFSKSCAETEDGKAQFEWYSWRDDIKAPSLTIEGKNVPVECSRGVLDLQVLSCS